MGRICTRFQTFRVLIFELRLTLKEIREMLKELPDLLSAFLALMVQVVLALLAGFGLWQLLLHH
jgi:hypothetical protein